MSADIVIRGGTVVDGSGAPGRRADVAITGDRISGIGPGLKGEQEFDAGGQVVAPGFIDIHTHYDAQVFWDPSLTPSSFHGVTSVVAGNCGFSIAPTRPEHHETIARTLENVEDMNVASLAAGIPWDFETFPEYLDSIRRRGTVLNFTAYVGHTALRLFVMGDEAYERAAKPEEVERMCRVVHEGIEAGAPGFATSLAPTHRGVDGKPIPSRFAERDEIEALCMAVGGTGRGVCHFAPGEAYGIKDLYELQPRVGVPFTYGALLTFPGDRYRKQVEINDQGWARGSQVWPQVTPRPVTMQITMADPFVLNLGRYFGDLMKESRPAREAAYRDPQWRARAAEDLEQQVMKPRWETYRVDESERFPELEGRKVSEIAQERGCEPLDVMCELALEEDLKTRFRVYIANDDTEGVDYLLTREHVVLGLSDAGAHVGQLCDAPMPTDLLGNWVRERGTLPLETAIRKLTGEPADLFGFVGRGYLREGGFADVAVIDPETVHPGPVRRVRDFPGDADRLTADRPAGVTHVLVNGVPIRRDGEPVNEGQEARPGVVPEIA